jgi:hypothetical protein
MTSLGKRLIKAALARRGYEIRPVAPPPPRSTERAAFQAEARAIVRRHRAQTLDTVTALRRKYERPVLGRVETWSLLERLAACVDPTDESLFGVSQQFHVLQVLGAMEADGVTDPDLLAAALIHDVGKVLLLTGEAPENAVCLNEPIGEYPAGVGLDHCVFQWNHDEFGYSRLRDQVSDVVAWIVRYHSLEPDQCAPLMNARDRDLADRYLRPFRRYDQGSKTPFQLPRKRLDDYRDLATALLPRTLVV